jgi:hypothetical protein
VVQSALIVALAVAAVILPACLGPNPAHCANRGGHVACAGLAGGATPICNVCVADNGGCVAGDVQSSCLYGGEAPMTTQGASTTDATATTDLTDSGPTDGTDAGTGAPDTDDGPECGNEIVEGAEQCDGPLDRTCADEGLGSGLLACGDDCRFDTAGCTAQPECGDGEAQGDEQCDGDDLRGLECTHLRDSDGNPYIGGTLACDPDTCTFDELNCIRCLQNLASCQTSAQCCNQNCDPILGNTCRAIG